MKISIENLRISILIFRYWMLSAIRLVFYHPSTYLTRVIDGTKSIQSLSRDEWKKVRKIVKGIHKISPLLSKKRKCLMEALITYHCTRKSGISAVLHIGAMKENDTIITHAWVTVDNETVIGGPLNGYRELIRTH